MTLEKHSFTLAGHRTSVALEPQFWAVLHRAAGEAGLLKLVAGVDAARAPGESLASSLRVWALAWALAGAENRDELISPLSR